MQRKKIVVTGLGVISAIGTGKESFFNNLCSGKNGADIIDRENLKIRRKYACEIKEDIWRPKNYRHQNKALSLAMTAVEEAVNQAGLDQITCRERISVSLGTTSCGALEFDKWYGSEDQSAEDNVPSSILEQYMLHTAAQAISETFDIRGMSSTFMTACASSATAIAVGCQWLLADRADVVVCGGVDVFRLISHIQMSQLRVIAQKTAKPFDVDRNGFLLGEGAGVLILETKEHAGKRNAMFYAELLGYGMSCDAHDISEPDTDGLIVAAEKAMHMAGVSCKDISLVKAQASGSVISDRAEMNAMNCLFKQNKDVKMTSWKGSLGHTAGAAGGIESVGAVLALNHQIIPPTVGTSQCEDGCKLNIILNEARQARIDTVLANYFGFGGNNVCLLFGKGER